MTETRIFKLPLTGKLKTKKPPDGHKNNPLRPLPIVEYVVNILTIELEGIKTPEELEFKYTIKEYDIDNNKATVEVIAESFILDSLEILLNTPNKDLYKDLKQKPLDKSSLKITSSKGLI